MLAYFTNKFKNFWDRLQLTHINIFLEILFYTCLNFLFFFAYKNKSVFQVNILLQSCVTWKLIAKHVCRIIYSTNLQLKRKMKLVDYVEIITNLVIFYCPPKTSFDKSSWLKYKNHSHPNLWVLSTKIIDLRPKLELKKRTIRNTKSYEVSNCISFYRCIKVYVLQIQNCEM